MVVNHLTVYVLIMVALAGVLSTEAVAQEPDYRRKSTGTRVLDSEGGTSIRMLVEASNLGGGEVEVAEITFPSGTSGGSHRHTAIEIFYILDGEFDHIVNGESHVLTKGMVGIVRPEDQVAHRVVSDSPVRALVIWAPGGEVDRIAPFFTERAVEASRP